MQKKFYCSYYFVVLFTYMAATFLYLTIRYDIINNGGDFLALMNPLVIISLLLLGGSICMQRRAIFIISDEFIHIRRFLSLKYDVFEIAKTEIEFSKEHVLFAQNGKEFFFYKKLAILNSWKKIISAIDQHELTKNTGIME